MRRFFLGSVIVCTALFFTGCVDNDYDLSDIDKTTQIKINDLTLPINLDKITLNDIIDTDGSEIKIVNLDGKEVYAVSQQGSFESDKIEIGGFTASPRQISNVQVKLRTNDYTSPGTRADVPSEVTTKFTLSESEKQTVDIAASDINDAIVSVSELGCEDTSISMSLTTTGLSSSTTLKFNKIVINFLKGLIIKSKPSNIDYDPASGVLTVTNLDCPGHKATISMVTSGVNLEMAGVKIKDKSIDYRSEVNLVEAEMEMVSQLTPGTQVSPEIVFTMDTEIGAFVSNKFTGVLKYSVEGSGLNINPIDLSDLPDFLNDDQTDLKLYNPQLYIGINNPVATYGLEFRSGFEITSVNKDGEHIYSLDNGESVTVDADKGINGPYNFVLSPAMPAKPLTDYAQNLKLVKFTDLSNVLSGNGLPSQIKIDLVDPCLPEQKVENFMLNTEISNFKGNYDFIAPLALERGSKIVYVHSEEGWGDDTLKDLTITNFTLTADATNDLPLNANLKVVPLYKNDFNDESEEAKPIAGVSGETTLEGGKTDQPISISLKGDIKNLDGIKITATVNPASTDAMAPNQTISLKNIKVTVSGNYETNFD